MGIEKQTTEPTSPETHEVLQGASRALAVEAMAVRHALGPERTLPDQVSQDEIDQRLMECTHDRIVYQDLAELSFSNELLMRRKALQLQADLQEAPDRVGIDRRLELIVANQAVTYHQYLPAAVRGVSELMQQYGEEMEAMIAHLPPERRIELEQERQQAVRYLHALKELMQERVHFASILSLDERIEELSHMPAQKHRLAELQKTRTAEQAALSPASQQILAEEEALRTEYLAEKDPTKKAEILQRILRARSEHIVLLDNRIIETLKGNPQGLDLPGAPKEFLPQRVYLRVLQERYNQVLALQTSVVQSTELTEAQRAEVQRLLRHERVAIMDRMVLVTKQMTAHHVAMSELTAIQHQFGDSYDFSGAFKPFGVMTPEEVRAKVEHSIDGAKEFHIGRLDAMAQQVNTSFDPNGLENLSDAAAMELVGSVDRLSGMVKGIILALVPEGEHKREIANWFDSVLPLAIRESLESGVGPDGRPLTREQKLQKIRDVIIAFRDTGSIGRLQGTLALFRGLPPAKTFVAQDVQEDVLVHLDGARFTASPEGQTLTLGDRLVTVNGATAYVLMLRQMKADTEAFSADYAQFLGSMEDLVDIRLGLKAEINTIKEGWLTLLKMLGISAAVAALLPWVVGGSAAGATIYLLKKAPAIARNITRVPGMAWGLLRPSAILTTGITALQAYRIYEDVRTLGEMDRIIEQREQLIIADLQLAGFVADPPDQNERFTYRDGGTMCTVNVAELKAADRGHEVGQIVRIGGSVVELPMILRALRAAKTGTSALRAWTPLIVLEVAVETITYGIDQKADRTFLARCPAWLLAKINVEGSIGDKKYGMLATASEWMLTDPVTSRPGEQKKDIREKMLFCMLHDELAGLPDLVAALYPTGMHPKHVDTFFREDFRSVLLPYYAARLWQLSDGALSLEDIREGRVGGFSLAPARTPDISSVNVRRALREALIMTLEHRKEQEYVHAVDALEQYRAVPDGDRGVQGVLADVVRTLGSTTVLGTPLHALEREQIRDAQGRTRVQRLIEELVMRARRNEPLAVPAGAVAGLGDDLDFSTGEVVFGRLVADPALRARLERVLPRDVEEQENMEGREWHDVRAFTDAVDFKLPNDPSLIMGSLAHFDYDTSYAATAADNIRSALGKGSIKSEPTLIDAFLGARKEQTTRTNALEHITTDAIELMETDRKVQEKRGSFRPNDRLAEAFFESSDEPPLVFTTGSVDHWVSRELTHVKLPSGLPDLPLRAVFYEGRTLPGNHGMVLATYVLGDLENGRVLILQQAAATAGLSNTNKQVIAGLLQPVTVGEAERKPGLTRMLEQARRTVVERRRASERSSTAERDARETQWREGRAQRDRTEATQNALRSQALDRAQRSAAMLYVPGAYLRDENERRFHLQAGEFRGNLQGVDVRMTSPFDASVEQSISAARPNRGTWSPQKWDAVSFSAQKESKSHTYTIRDLSVLSHGPSEKFTRADQELTRAVLTTPLNLSGHPKERDSVFVRSVREYELHRLLDLATYRASLSWGPQEYRTHLFAELLPLYEKTKDRGLFLHALLNNLLTEQVISHSAYNRIIRNMKSF